MFSIIIGTSSSSTKNVVCIVPLLLTQEDLRNAASTISILVGSGSTPYSAPFGMRWSLAGAPTSGLGSVAEHVVDCSFKHSGT